MLLDDPGRVRSQKINVVCQIQRFDFYCILVVSRKVIIWIPPVLGRNPLYDLMGMKWANWKVRLAQKQDVV